MANWLEEVGTYRRVQHGPKQSMYPHKWRWRVRKCFCTSLCSYRNRALCCFWRNFACKLKIEHMCKHYLYHWHLREIDRSLAIVGAESIHSSCIECQSVLHCRCRNWQHNCYCQQRQVGRANEQSTSLRCLWPLLIEVKWIYLRLYLLNWPGSTWWEWPYTKL